MNFFKYFKKYFNISVVTRYKAALHDNTPSVRTLSITKVSQHAVCIWNYRSENFLLEAGGDITFLEGPKVA